MPRRRLSAIERAGKFFSRRTNGFVLLLLNEALFERKRSDRKRHDVFAAGLLLRRKNLDAELVWGFGEDLAGVAGPAAHVSRVRLVCWSWRWRKRRTLVAEPGARSQSDSLGAEDFGHVPERFVQPEIFIDAFDSPTLVHPASVGQAARVVALTATDNGAIAFVLSLLSGESFGFRFGEKNELLGAIFVSKTETQLTFEHGAKRLKEQEPQKRGRGFKWRAPTRSVGRNLFKPQTVLLSRSRAVGRGDIRRRRTELRKTFGASINEWVFLMGAKASESRFLGVPPLERKRPEEEEWF